VIRDETIPAEEKIHSLFEPHTEWLYKGKSNKRVELGHNILVTSDQWGFIVDHKVVKKQADVSLSIPLADRLLSRYGEGLQIYVNVFPKRYTSVFCRLL